MSLRPFRCLFAVSLLVSLTTPVLGAAPTPAGAAPPPKSLRVVFTHDLHSHLAPIPTTTADGGVTTSGGFARLASVIREERDRFGDATLVLDAGDFSMGTLFHTVYATDALELRALGRIGYDATTLGNHELDFRSAGLAAMLASAKASGDPLPRVVAANLTTADVDGALARSLRDYPVAEYAVVEKNGLRVGIFGLIGKDAEEDVGFAPDVEFAESVATAKRIVGILRETERVDVVVALSHSGTSTDRSRSEDEILAREVPAIDLIVSGHTHTVLTEPIVVGRTVIVSSGCYGRYAGLVSLDFAGDSARVTDYQLRELTPEVAEDPEVAAQVAADKRVVERGFLAGHDLKIDQPIAETTFSTEPLRHLSERPGEAGLGNLIADAFRAAIERAEGDRYVYVAAAVHPVGAIRSSFARGELTPDDVFRVLSLGLGEDGAAGYALTTFYLTGAEIEQALEVNTTLAALKGDYYLQVSGLRFAYNPNRVPLDRMTTLLIAEPDGEYRPIEPARLYRVCADYQSASMLGSVMKKSFGILQVTPKDANGQPIPSAEAALVDVDLKSAEVQELKAWTALAEYLRSQPDPDGNGLPNLPERYQEPEGRIVAAPSWAPSDLLGGAGRVTFGFLGVFAVVLALVYGLARGALWGTRRLLRR